MVRSASAASLLNLLLPQWQELLQGWAIDDSISRAATEALRLNAEPPLLAQLVNRWAAGDFSDLPQVVLLPASSMPGAAGAYAISTGTIYLNADWLTTAAPQQALAVLTEELGHHLDNLLNTEDTPGDEGELFAARLKGDGLISAQQRQRLLGENDLGSVVVDGKVLAVELAATVQVALSSVATVTEDGPESLHVVFSRTGDVSAALTVNFSVVGSAGFGSDYDQRGAANFESTSGSVTFVAGSNVAIFSLDPRSDVVSDGVESVILTMAEGDGYSLGSRSSVTGIILDNDVEPGVVVRAAIPVTDPQRTRGEIRNLGAFAVIKADGSVVTWGNPSFGGDSSRVADQLCSGVVQIFSARMAFAALKTDGSVVSWGGSTVGNLGGSSVDVAELLSSGVIQVFSTDYAFAALKTNGSVVTWDYSPMGGSGGDSAAIADQINSGVTQIFSTQNAFAALKADGSVATWGNSYFGGESSGVAGKLSSAVTQIISTGSAFAALKADGSVVTWGNSEQGGDSSGVAVQLSSGVIQIYSTSYAFAALKADGSVVTWGSSSSGGTSSGVADQLGSGVTHIVSTDGAFGALKANGSVVTWGLPDDGGDSSAVAGALNFGVVRIFSSAGAFAALKADGSVVTWGLDLSGGNSSGVSGQLSSGVTQIFSNQRTFAALKADGSVVTWGDSTWGNLGGDSSAVATQLSSGVTQIFSTASAFAALKADGTVVTWGDTYYGGNSSGVASQLTNVVAFANPYTDDRLVPPALPSITLAVSPASVTEDGSDPLTFTFTLTGPTDSELTVNYSVGGTATLGTDYRGITAEGEVKTVTFATGVSTAIVTVEATPDSESEPNETVELTLASGCGYTIGTQAAVSGVITKDDSSPSTVQVALSSVATVTEDGPESLHVVFSRTGDVSAALTVNFVVGGSAAFSSDYDQRGATSFTTSSGSVTFAAGSSVAILSLDPRSDAIRDGDETVILSLAEGASYALGSRSSVKSTILDNDVEPGVVVRAAVPVADPQRGRGEYRADRAFAALRSNGSVVTWGDPTLGGDSSEVASRLSSGIIQVFSTSDAFAALKVDGSVVTWGGYVSPNSWQNANAGNSTAVAAQLSSGVTQIFSTQTAFAALKSDGSVVTWGMDGGGGNSSAVAGQLGSGVTQIFATGGAFAALKADGSVVTWGWMGHGFDISGTVGQLSSGVTQIFSTGGAFAALKADGSVVTWGIPSLGSDSSAVASQLSSGVTQMISNWNSFAALKADGSVITWGIYSGDSSAVASQLSSGVTNIFSTGSAFAALKADGSVVTWGDSSFGGDSSGVAGDLTNVVAFANPFTDDRLVPLSSITLAASQASVTEDGSDPLTFTFTRTGPTDSELTVNYSLGGTATLGTDYSGIAAEGEVKTVTFTSGSATASVVLTTIADAFLEGTESIVLAIATGPGYITGNVSSVSADLLDAVNDGQASFSITGTPAVGQTLTATVATPDPDGNGSFLHTWQASADGTSWSSISSGQELTIAPAQEGQQLRLLTTYTDAQGFSESVTTAAADVIAGGDSSVPLLDAIWAGPHQIGLRFSEAVHSNASSALAGLFSVLVNGSARSITSAGFAAADGSAASSGPLLLLDLAGEILDRAAALSLSYSDPGAAAGSGSIRDLAGNRLVSLAPQPINHYITPSSNNSLGLGLAYDVLTLSGSSAINGTGNSRHNTITGNNAANLLDGGAGADTLIGGGGDDRYLADHSGDLVIEQADQGIDTVISSISWVLASHLEHLELSGSNAINGTGNDLDNRITGNNGNNVLSGGGGNDSLDGGAGRDRLIGSEGDDSYWVDQITDTVVEQAAQGIDTVFSSFSWVLGAHLENLVLLGSGPLTGLGNSLDNTIIGNSGSNILDGGDGGRDVLTGGAGADQFRFSSRPHDFSAGAGDVITDFNPSENDRIRIHRSAFGITASRATISTVVSSDAVGAALESSVLFVYDTSKGQLHWNQNGVGVGAGDGGVLAVLTNRPSLTPSQFTLV